MNMLVDTDEGTACICGDVIYDVVNQLDQPVPAGACTWTRR